MSLFLHNSLHFILFFLVFLIITSLQMSLWIQLFPQAPNPSLWISLIVFTCFYRNLFEYIVSVYFISIITVQFTAMPIGLFILCNCSIASLTLLLRSRFILQKPIHLALITMLFTLLFPVFHFLFSLTFESNPIQNFEYFTWLISSLLTGLISIYIFQFYIWFDQLMAKAWPTEIGT